MITTTGERVLQTIGDYDLLAKVGELAVSREITSVKARLQRMNPVEEQASYNRMSGDLVGLEKRRKALLDRAAGA